MMVGRHVRRCLFWLAGLLLASSVQSATVVPIRGTGATFPALVYARWAARFNQLHPQVNLSYVPSGSGEGIRQITARAVAFGASDSPLSAQALRDRGLVQVPMLVGGLVPVLNLPGIRANQLVLTGEVLADIMLGRLAYWDDARIAELNTGLKLSHLPIRRVVRADASGTSEAFSHYLAMSSPAFAAGVPVSLRPAWPGEVLTGQGMDGMLAVLKTVPGGISYAAYDRVLAEQLSGVRLRTPGGRELAASEEGFRAALLSSDVYLKGDDTATLLNRPRPDAWPITLTTYVLLDAHPKDAVLSDWTAHFVYWCFLHGDELIRGSGFAALPDRVQAKLSGRLMQIHGPGGIVPKFIQP